MTRFRPLTIESQHHLFADATLDRTPTDIPTALVQYLRQEGIFHLLTVNRQDDAQNHLLKIDFLDEFVSAHDSFLPPLSAFRVIGVESSKNRLRPVLAGHCQAESEPNAQSSRLIDFFYGAGWYEQAESLAAWHLKNCQTFLEPHSQITQEAQHQLSLIHQSQGLWSQAEAAYRAALSSAELSIEDRRSSLVALGTTLLHLNKLDEAEIILKENLDFCTTHLSSDHPDIGNALHNVAALYAQKGLHEDACHYYTEAVSHRIENLSTSAIPTLRSQQNLALTYKRLEQNDQAAQLYHELCSKMSTMLGPTHPETIRVYTNFAMFKESQKAYAEALEHIQFAQLNAQHILGEQHPMTLVIMSNHATILRRLEDYDKAALLYRQVITLQSQSIGENHLDCILTKYKLGTLLTYLEDDKYSDEIPTLLNTVLQVRRSQLGLQHNHTIIAASTLAEYYAAQKQHTQAAEARQLEWEGRCQRLGEKAARTVSTRYKLGLHWLKSKNATEAIAHLEPTLAAEIELYGEDSGDIAITHWNLARAYRMLDRPEDASQHRYRCWTIESVPDGPLADDPLYTAAALFEDCSLANEMALLNRCWAQIQEATQKAESLTEAQQQAVDKLRLIFERGSGV